MLSSIEWSPDSRKLVAYRRTPGYPRTVYFIRTSPEDQVQPRLETTQSLNDNPTSSWGAHYRKPGDVVDHDRPALFDVALRTQIVIDDRLFANPYEMRGASWWEDGRAGHTNGGRYGTRKRNDYFVRHLLGVEPPAWNALITEATDGMDDGSEDWQQAPESELYPRGY